MGIHPGAGLGIRGGLNGGLVEEAKEGKKLGEPASCRPFSDRISGGLTADPETRQPSQAKLGRPAGPSSGAWPDLICGFPSTVLCVSRQPASLNQSLVLGRCAVTSLAGGLNPLWGGVHVQSESARRGGHSPQKPKLEAGWGHRLVALSLERRRTMGGREEG